MASRRGITRGFSQRYGGHVNRAFQELLDRGVTEDEFKNLYTLEPCVVYKYYPEKQRVDIVLKNDPDSPPIRNVPVAGAGGDFRFITPFQTLDNNDPEPTVGFVAFSRSDSTQSWKLRDRSEPETNVRHRPQSAIFIDTVLLQDEAPYSDDFKEAGAGLNDLDPKDAAIIHKSGSRIIFKDNGDMLILAAGDVYIGPEEVSAASYAAAARTGDGVAHPGGITGGSGRVNIG